MNTRGILAIVFLSLPAGAAIAQGASPAPIAIDARRQLFLDDALVAEMTGLERSLHQPQDHPATPVMVSEHPWEHRRIIYGSVLYFPAEQKFKCWYLTANLYDSRPGYRGYRPEHHVPIEEAAFICYAESDDGLHWVKPKLGLCEYRGSKQNNIVLTCPGSHFDGPSVVYTPDDRERPFKMMSFIGRWPYDEQRIKEQWGEDFRFGVDVAAHYAWSSKDGLHWTPLNDGEPVLRANDRSMFWYDPQRKIYVGAAKGNQEGKRAQRYVWSKDFVDWRSPGDWLMTADERDHPLDQAEAAYGFPYGAQWIGYCEMRRMRFNPPKINWELMTSRDGRHWSRPIREVFHPDGPEESWRHLVLKVFASPPLVRGDRLWIYYGGKTGLSDALTGSGPSQALCLATLRRDGFVSLHAGPEAGRLVTRRVTLSGRRLHLNADAAGGEIRVALQTPEGQPISGFSLDDCRPIEDDATDVVVQWRGAQEPDLPQQRPLRMVLSLKNAQLYSLWSE